MKLKIGVGLITCNREDFFQNCLQTIPQQECMIIINDGKLYKNSSYSGYTGKIIQHDNNKGVGRSKNEALTFLLDKGCTNIFLLEDDILIKNQDIFSKYIDASRITGLRHMNYAYHGSFNLKNGLPNPRKIIEYENNIKISLHSHLTASFSYYTADVLKKTGLMDTFYKNLFEHVDHTYKIIKEGYLPPFRWFPDISDSYLCITDQDPGHKKSIIRKNWLLYKFKYKFYNEYFRKKYGYRVEEIPDSDENFVQQRLNEIKEKFHNNG